MTIYAGFAGQSIRPNQHEVRQPTMAAEAKMPNRIMGLPSGSGARMQYMRNVAMRMPAAISQNVIYGVRFRVNHEMQPITAPMTSPAATNGMICKRRSIPAIYAARHLKSRGSSHE